MFLCPLFFWAQDGDERISRREFIDGLFSLQALASQDEQGRGRLSERDVDECVAGSWEALLSGRSHAYRNAVLALRALNASNLRVFWVLRLVAP